MRQCCFQGLKDNDSRPNTRTVTLEISKCKSELHNEIRTFHVSIIIMLRASVAASTMWYGVKPTLNPPNTNQARLRITLVIDTIVISKPNRHQRLFTACFTKTFAIKLWNHRRKLYQWKSYLNRSWGEVHTTLTNFQTWGTLIVFNLTPVPWSSIYVANLKSWKTWFLKSQRKND